jgi:hypothetical protein
MNSFFSIRRFLQVPRTLLRLLVACIAIVLFINIFVGVLVYQNPVSPLIDVKNMLFVLLAGTSLAVSLFGSYHMLLFLENNWSHKWLRKNWPATLGLTALTVALSFLCTL